MLALLLAWGIGVLLLHGFVTFQIWDRYLLPLAPWLALVVAGPLAHALLAARRALPITLLALAIVLTPPALAASQGRLPIGADHGDYHGLRDAIAWLQDRPGPLVLYHQTLGWHYRAYLFDHLRSDPLRTDQASPRIELRWFPSAVYLADNAAKTPYPPTYLVIPDWAPQADLPFHLAQRGLALETRLCAGRFSLVEITHLPGRACDWCSSHAPQPGSQP